VAALLRLGEGLCREARLALTGVGGVPWRAREAEKALVGREVNPRAIADAAQAVRETVEPLSDLHGSADYRRQLASVLTRRALEAALGNEKA
jgi:carbon-monoxide dehydrogenase medium subunit